MKPSPIKGIFETLLLLIPVPLIIYLAGDNLGKKYIPRSHCMQQEQDLITASFIGDSVTSLSYLVIGTMLLVFFSRVRAYDHTKIFLLFGLFIFLCGVTHIFDVLSLWVTYYWIDVIFKNLTAVVSFLAMLQLPLIGRIILGWKKAHDDGVETERLRQELHNTKHEMQKLMLLYEEKTHGGK